MLFRHSIAGDESDSFEFDEIRSAGENDAYVVSQISAVGDEIHTVHGADAGVLDPILLVFCKKPLFSGSDEGLGRNLKSGAIFTLGQTDEIRQVLAAQGMHLISKASIRLPEPSVWLAKLFEVLKAKDHAAMPMIA